MAPAVRQRRLRALRGPTCRRLQRAAVTILLLLVSGVSARSDDRTATSIAEFVASKNRWDRLVGQPLVLEGRYTVLSQTDLRFAKCDLKFMLARPVNRPSTKNVEVAGRLVRKDGGLEFHVTDLKQRESDADQLKLKRSLADSSNPQAVFEVAEWARERGAFYGDEELLKEAMTLYREGLKIASEHLKPGDVDGLRELAKRSREFGVDESISLDFLHRAIRLEWEAAQKSDSSNEEYARVLGLIKRELPGATSPLSATGLSIRRDYEQAPVAVYRVADAGTRRRLARAFYLEVALANVMRSAAKDGSNGYQVAQRLEHELPELESLADEFRRKELKHLSEGVGKLTRERMLELSRRYNDRGDKQQASAVIRNWLTLQESRATAAGPNALMELGDEYINLLQDERAAARIYQLAYAKNPQLAAARDWLTTHGYELNGKDWGKPGEPDDDATATAVSQAIAEGRVQLGMTGKQVLKSLGTTPTSSLQVASAGAFAELWVFKDHGISVRLQRHTAGGDAEVVQIDTVD